VPRASPDNEGMKLTAPFTRFATAFFSGRSTPTPARPADPKPVSREDKPGRPGPDVKTFEHYLDWVVNPKSTRGAQFAKVELLELLEKHPLECLSGGQVEALTRQLMGASKTPCCGAEFARMQKDGRLPILGEEEQKLAPAAPQEPLISSVAKGLLWGDLA
jgi:hypothetical protein